MNSPDCMVLDQSVNNTWKNLKYGGLNEKFQARRRSRRTNGGFINNVYTSWNDLKIEHIRNPIDVQRKSMLEIIEKQGGPTIFFRLIQENQLSSEILGNIMSFANIDF